MEALPNEEPNEDAAASWQGDMGRLWLENLDHQEEMLAPIGALLLADMALAPGERVVEIGPGGGWLARRMAQAVGASGRVVGLELSAALLAEAARRGRQLPQLGWFEGDAATATPPDAPFDRLVSRFGVMFFAAPPAAFRHLATLLRPGGRLHLAVWDSPKRNPWMVAMQKVARAHLDLPVQEPLAPGPFQLADAAFLDGVLEGAGFVGIERRRLAVSMQVGGAGATPAAAAAHVCRSMMLGMQLDGQPAALREAVRRDLESLYQRHLTAKGVIMPGSIWLVAARLS